MRARCTNAVGPGRLAGPLALSLALPVALALCLIARPYLGLPSQAEAGGCRGLQDEACGLTDLGVSIPAPPLARVDPIRIHCAWKEYKLLSNYRHGFRARLRASHSLSEGLQIRDVMSKYKDDYRYVYQEVTPGGRRRARLPDPDGEAGVYSNARLSSPNADSKSPQ